MPPKYLGKLLKLIDKRCKVVIPVKRKMYVEFSLDHDFIMVYVSLVILVVLLY